MLAGLGAGFGTGLAGLSAAAVIAPILITFLDISAYEAVGIALASDVLASAASAITYGRNRHLDIKNGLVMLITVLVFTLVGSFTASLLPATAIGGLAMFMPFVAGMKFLIRPVMSEKESRKSLDRRIVVVQSILCGAVIGFVCGFVGAGGGMLMLLILVSVLGYELKTAVGTSVFIMAFTALTGAVSHFAIGGFPDWKVLLLCIAFTLIGAMVTSRFANMASPKVLNRVLGTGLVVLSIAMLIVNLVK